MSTSMYAPWNRNAGFTLIELMIVVAIIGIIASIAYPSYRENVMATHRANAQADLMELAQWMERKYLQQNYDYTGGGTPTLPQTQSPETGTAMYELTLSAVAKNSFELKATPKGGQTSDRCGTLTLEHTGQKGAGDTDCW